MGKRDRFGSSIGDKLLEALANTDKKQSELSVSPLAKKQGIASPQSNEKINYPPTEKGNSKPRSSSPPKGKNISKRNNVSVRDVYYAAATKTVNQIRQDISNASSSARLRKAILEGLRTHYYDLQKQKPTRDVQFRIHDIKDIKDELERLLQFGEPLGEGKINAAAKVQSQATNVSDKAPDAVRNYRSLFSGACQFSSANAGRDVCDVVIGLDFGTACSKVAIRTPFHQNRAFIVPFDVFGHPSCRYLLPTHLSLSSNHYYLPVVKEAAHFNDLKLRMIASLGKEDDFKNDIDNAIAYLALVLRYVRSWFIREQAKAYGQYALSWHVNIGLPSSTAEDSNLCNLYRRVAYAAWALSVGEGDITYHRLVETTEALHLGQISDDDLPPIEVFPEMAAEVTGYTQSDMRRDGLHLLIDAGAGTLDICGFNVYSVDGENRLPIFSTSVEPRGVLSIHLARRAALLDRYKLICDGIVPDAGTPLCAQADYIPSRDICRETLSGADESMLAECRRQLTAVAQHLRKSMHPNAEEWRTRLPVFLCGGGSAVPMYRQLVKDFSVWLKEQVGSDGVRQMILPKPDRVHGEVSEEDYHRFAVATGLSHYPADIDRVMTDIEPVRDEKCETNAEPWFMRREYAYLVDF